MTRLLAYSQNIDPPSQNLSPVLFTDLPHYFFDPDCALIPSSVCLRLLSPVHFVSSYLLHGLVCQHDRFEKFEDVESC